MFKITTPTHQERWAGLETFGKLQHIWQTKWWKLVELLRSAGNAAMWRMCRIVLKFGQGIARAA